MSTDLWPADVKSDNSPTPAEILTEQAEYLATRTDGMLTGKLSKREEAEGTVLVFEVQADRLPTTVHLFDVHQQRDFDYPAAIVVPKESIPYFLRQRRQRSDSGPSPKHFERLFGTAQETIIVATPQEFRREIQQVLARPAIKGIVFSLIGRSHRSSSGAKNATSSASGANGPGEDE